MSVTALCLALLSQDAAPALPTATDVMSRLFARYHGAKTVVGTAVSTITVGDTVITIATDLQVERPNKVYIRQTVREDGRVFLLVGDGKTFSYGKPVGTEAIDADRSSRLIETHFPYMTLGDVYRAAARSLAERSIVLDLAVADTRDMALLRDQWATIDLTGTVEQGGETLYRIVGQWRPNAVEPVSANFGLFVTKDGDLRRYVIEQLPGAGALSASRQWSVDLQIDAPVKPELFTVVR